MKLQGFTKQDIDKGKKMNMAPYYLVAFVASLITAYILEWLMNALKVSSIKGALLLVFLIWLGFYATTLSGSIIWEGKPAKLYILNVSYWLVSLLVSSAILFYL
jgi:hypothetical protein